jgi:hypothetical protein
LSLHSAAALVLAFIGPLAFALEVQAALPRLLSFGLPALLLLAARTGVTVLGLIAGRRLSAAAADGWRLARLWAIAAAAAHVITLSTPWFPSNRTPGEKRFAFIFWLAIYAGWAALATRQARRGETDPTAAM